MVFTIASKEQLPIVRDLAYRIWPDTYGTTHTIEELDYMLSKFYAVDALEQQIENGHVFVLAEENDTFIGFVAYELFSEHTNSTKIHKLYVLPQTQGRGIGKALVDYVREEAIINKNEKLFLNVNKLNKAKDFYHRYGFTITKDIIIDIGEGFVMDDYVMELSV
jgi:ribosomal protein S18 acetylase RimI-like enzyme